ncbi:hypothetical protein [Streptomyces ortus]|uniref:Uncharacterized protein n=1 Tax=Streptomyces ortus TaxID=2867268 RepID=A0ABT3UWY1_9ACTN|nr:hypothetical protein [Streptomyces ortus]MCX4231843.1 hypothetical protein [Streptomyces ortus]
MYDAGDDSEPSVTAALHRQTLRRRLHREQARLQKLVEEREVRLVALRAEHEAMSAQVKTLAALRADQKALDARCAEEKVLPGVGLLRGAAGLLPSVEREDWLEEQRGYLADLPSRRARWVWVLRQLAAMPRYTFTVRTGREKEAA